MSSPFNLIVIILMVLVAGVMVGNYSVQVIKTTPAKVASAAKPVTRLEGILISNDGKEPQPWLK